MNNLSKIYFCFFMIQSTHNFTKFYHSEHFASMSSVSMNGKEFTHTKKSDNGMQSEQFLVNQVPVEKDDYFNQLNALKLQEMNHQEKETQRKADEQQSMKDDLKTALVQKLIKQSMANLSNALATIEEPILKPYLFYESKGINSLQDLEQLKAWTSQMQKNLKSTLQDQDFLTLQKLAHEIEIKVEKIHHCLKQSIQKATSECDDTATLKKLLMLVEE